MGNRVFWIAYFIFDLDFDLTGAKQGIKNGESQKSAATVEEHWQYGCIGIPLFIFDLDLNVAWGEINIEREEIFKFAENI